MNRMDIIEQRLDALEKAFIQSQKNQVPITARADSAYSGVKTLTPFTATQTAYIGDTEVTFEAPEGNLTVYFDRPYTVDRDGSMVTIYFEELEEVKDITISII